METMKQFGTYVSAFEATLADDDWSRLESLFCEHAVYRVVGSDGYDCELRGRDAILAGLRKALDGFDRRCERRVELVGAPVEQGEAVRFRAAACYRRGDSPELRVEIDEEVVFEADRIVRMTDLYPHGLGSEMAEWLAKWGEGLDPSYT